MCRVSTCNCVGAGSMLVEMARRVERIEQAIMAAGKDDIKLAAQRPRIRSFAASVIANCRKDPPETAHHGKRGGRPPTPVYIEHKGRRFAAISTRLAAKEIGATYSWMQRKMMRRDGGWYLPECRFKLMGREASWERLLEEAGGQAGAMALINLGEVQVVK